MRSGIALTLLAGPTLCVPAWHVREHGISFERGYGHYLFPAIAVVLVLTAIAVVLSPEAGNILEADFFPARGFLPLLVSGVAFAAAICPDCPAVLDGSLHENHTPGLRPLISFVAWLWILVIAIVTAIVIAS